MPAWFAYEFSRATLPLFAGNNFFDADAGITATVRAMINIRVLRIVLGIFFFFLRIPPDFD